MFRDKKIRLVWISKLCLEIKKIKLGWRDNLWLEIKIELFWIYNFYNWGKNYKLKKLNHFEHTVFIIRNKNFNLRR